MAERDVHIIENTRAAHDAFGYGYGADFTVVREDDLRALREGKCWAFQINCGEYSHFIVLETEHVLMEA